MTADLWKIVQDQEIQLQKSIESKINVFLISTAAAAVQTRAQSQAAESQTTIAEESQLTVQLKSVEFAHLTTTDQKIYMIVLSIHESKLKAYNTQ